MSDTRTVALHTLGCKLNFSETSAMGRLLEQNGFVKKDFEEEADVYVLNTCSVTENANKECRQIIRKIKRKSPQSTVVVTGCYAQLKPKEIAAIEGVDLVLGAAEKFSIVNHLRDYSRTREAKICSCDIEDVSGFHDAYSFGDRTRSFLKVQDGCDYNCSFCTIPMARGKSRSDTISHAVENATRLAIQGVKEIVLTGVNLGDFGKENQGRNGQEEDFYSLIKELDKISAIKRYRISSIEPNLLTPEIIYFVANSRKFMPHFHIPLQSGSNRILGLMRRRYRRELYAERVTLIRKLIPHACIGVDVITGFPSESEEDFEEMRMFLNELPVSYFHVFTYSERENTVALNIKPTIPIPVRHERNKRLHFLSFKKTQLFTREHLGEIRPVLFEGHDKNGMMEGYTDNYIRITTPYKKEWENEIIDWEIQ